MKGPSSVHIIHIVLGFFSTNGRFSFFAAVVGSFVAKSHAVTTSVALGSKLGGDLISRGMLGSFIVA